MERWLPSSKRNPCPICGRLKDGDCRIRQDGQMVFCHRGKSQSPPESLKVGDTLSDAEGRTWAYTGESRADSRDGAVFVIHQEQTERSLPFCGAFSPAPTLPAVKNNAKCISTIYQYSSDLRVIRYDYEQKKKDFQPQFYFNEKWNAGSGSKIWPFYGSLDNNSGSIIVEVEGEKCVDILRTQGIAAITHPGHQRDQQNCAARYAGLATAGIKTVYFISDNDAAGRKKAASFMLAAQSAEIEFCIIPAESICSGVPEGGSVDNMPAEELHTLIATALKSAGKFKPTPLNRISYGKIKKALQDFYCSEPASSADIQAGIADIASAHDASVFDTRRIWDSLEEDRQLESEALSATSAIVKRQELEHKRKSIDLADYLPEPVCHAIKELTGNLACDSLTAAAVVLTTAAGSFCAGHRIDAGDGLFVKEPVVWMLLAGPSGSGKSPIMRHLCRDRLRLVLSHYNQLSLDAEHEYEARYGAMPKNKRPDPPEPLRTCVSDFTTESLNGIIGDNHRKGLGTFIYSEEVKAILGNFDEYKVRGKGRGKEAFLCLFDGNVDSQHRIGRRSKMIIGKVQNALLGAVQPGVFRRMIEEGDDAGLFARCLMVPLVNEYVEPNFFRSPEEIQAVHMAEQTLENFYLQCLGLPPLVLRLEKEAVELFAALSRDTYEKSQMVSLESQRAIFGKRLGYVLQIALTMHLCRVAGKEISEQELYVSKQTLARSVMLVDLLQSYAIVEQQESQMQRHGAFDLNRRIHLYSRSNNGCTASQFTNNCIPIRHRASIKISHVRAAMDQLVAMGLGEWKDGKDSSKPGACFVALGRFPD